MTKIQFYPISWEKLHEVCFVLSRKILAKKLKFDRIVCVSRGGLVVARILSDFLSLPVSNFTIVSYKGVNQRVLPKIVEPLGVEIKNQRILLVDEIVDQGTTLQKAIEYLESKSAKKITTLAPYIKPWSRPKPDFWREITDKWVIFPYEARETIEELNKIWQKEKWSREKIKKELTVLGFSKEMIESFLSRS